MPSYITVAEAASYLGVSKATLRNWDREGKLRAHRHPLNRYRVYDLEELRALRPQIAMFEQVPPSRAPTEASDVRTVKRVVARLHAVLRDTDGHSSIIERFDELTKLLFLKLMAEREGVSVFESLPREGRGYAGRIRKAYSELCGLHPSVIPPRFTKLLCSDATINQCGAALAAISFAHANFDLKGVVYEEVIRGTFDKGDNQQFFTPHQVVSFMVAFLKPYLRGVVADPACGTAGFLTAVVRQGIPVEKLVGFEIDERLAWVSAINLLLHGTDRFEVHLFANGGSLGRAVTDHFGKFDVILTNPPFGSDFSDDALHDFELGRGRTSRRRGILFIERCWSFLKPGGVVGIVIDEGVLNLPSARDVRHFILGGFDVLAIVSLPESAFMPYANVNASILFLKKSDGPQRSRRVLFGRADDVGRKSNGDDDLEYDDSGNARLNSDLPVVLEAWERHNAGQRVRPSGFAFVADVTENLVDDAALRLDFRYHHPSRWQSRELLKGAKYPVVSLADLCEERNESMIPASELGDQLILYTGLAHIEAANGLAHQVPTPAASLKSAVKRYEPGDILFARMRPNLRKVALVTFPDGGYASTECVVLTPRQNESGAPVMSPPVLAAILRSDLVFGQILHLIGGIGRPRLNVTDLRRVLVPVPPEGVQSQSKAEFEGRLSAARELRSKARDLLGEAAALESQAVDELAKRLVGG